MTGTGEAGPPDEPAGGPEARDHVADVAGEAARLFEALRDAATAWAVQASDGTGGGAQPGAQPGAHAGAGAGAGAGPAEHPAGCTYCPLCAAFRRLQRTRPEVVTQLREVAATLASSLAAFAHEHPDGGPSPDRHPWSDGWADPATSAAGADRPRPPSSPEPSPRPERIEVWE